MQLLNSQKPSGSAFGSTQRGNCESAYVAFCPAAAESGRLIKGRSELPSSVSSRLSPSAESTWLAPVRARVRVRARARVRVGVRVRVRVRVGVRVRVKVRV